MQQKTREAIEAWAKKAGFHKHATKEIWMENRIPNMKIIDLSTEPLWIGIGASEAQRIEAENSGIALIQDYKEKILQIYKSSEHQNEKPPEAGSHIPAPPQEQEINESHLIHAPVSGGESNRSEELPYICAECKTGITATQRTDSVKALGKAFCKACISKKAEQIAEKMKPKEDIKAPEPKPEPVKETKKKSSGKKKDEKEPTEEKIGEVKATKTPAPEQIKPVMCKECGFELSHIRALEYQICEGCAEKRKIAAEATVPLKSREAPKEKTMSEKPESKDVVPAGKGANVPAQKSDHEIDEMIERAKARKFAEGQGSSYKVSGKERPDSAMIQKIANECGISTEILLAEQTDIYSHVVTRGHLGDTYVDAVVHHDFDIEFQLKTMEIIEKNPQILDHYEGIVPVIKEGAKIIKKTNQGEEQIDAKYYLIHALLSFKKFSLRDAATKSAAIVQLKLLNRDARDPEEIKSEQSERDLVEKQKRK